MRRLAGLVLLAFVVGCGGPAPTAGTSVALHDGSIAATSTRLAPGAVEIEVANVGEFVHTLVITTADGQVVTATDLVQPGAKATLQVALPAGTYQFTCRIVSEGADGTIFDHYQLGMVQTVTVGA